MPKKPTASQLAPLERAQAQLATAAAAIRLLQLYLKARGASPSGDGHASANKEAVSRLRLPAAAPVARTPRRCPVCSGRQHSGCGALTGASLQERYKQYHRKVFKLEAEVGLSQARKALEVDVAAVNRFITHAVPDLNAEQRQALRQAGGAAPPRQQQRAGRKQHTGGASRDAALAFLDETMADIQREGLQELAEPHADASAGADASASSGKDGGPGGAE